MRNTAFGRGFPADQVTARAVVDELQSLAFYTAATTVTGLELT